MDVFDWICHGLYHVLATFCPSFLYVESGSMLGPHHPQRSVQEVLREIFNCGFETARHILFQYQTHCNALKLAQSFWQVDIWLRTLDIDVIISAVAHKVAFLQRYGLSEDPYVTAPDLSCLCGCYNFDPQQDLWKANRKLLLAVTAQGSPLKEGEHYIMGTVQVKHCS